MKKIYFISIAFIVFLVSCKKEKNGDIVGPAQHADPALAFLDNAVSDPYTAGDYFIKGDFDGHAICFTTKGTGDKFFTDTFMNAYFIYHDKDSITNDNLYLLRTNADQSIMMALYCGQTHITGRSFPYDLPHPNLEHCEFTEFQLINMRANTGTGQNSPQDNFTFLGYTGQGVTLTFTSLSPDNVVEGKFEGYLKTNTGSTIIVKNGKFRLKFVVDNVYITGDSSTGHLMALSRRAREEMLGAGLTSNKANF